MAEGENPTRRYRSFRPRQAARGFITNTGGSNNTVNSLYNNSTAAQLLIVRDFIVIPFSNLQIATYYTKGVPAGTAGGYITPLLPGEAALPGILYAGNVAALPANADYEKFAQSPAALWEWQHEFPFAVLPPTWTLNFFMQSAIELDLSILFEAVFPDELDFVY